MDDSGYGFDNIGDVLSLSPMLMEKYINAARIVRASGGVWRDAIPRNPLAREPDAEEDSGRHAGDRQRHSILDARLALCDVSLPGGRRV